MRFKTLIILNNLLTNVSKSIKYYKRKQQAGIYKTIVWNYSKNIIEINQ